MDLEDDPTRTSPAPRATRRARCIHIDQTLARSIDVAVVDPDHPSIPTSSPPLKPKRPAAHATRASCPSRCHEITKRQATGRPSCRRLPVTEPLRARTSGARPRGHIGHQQCDVGSAARIDASTPSPGPESSRVTQQRGTAARASNRPGKRRRRARSPDLGARCRVRTRRRRVRRVRGGAARSCAFVRA